MSEGTAARGDAPQESLQQRLLRQLRGNPLLPLLLAGAAVVAIVVALMLWARSPDYRVLYSNLNEADGGRIISELDSRGVPYQLSQGGQALLVPGDQVHTLRLQLAEQGLPQGGNVGFELMDSQAFGISQFAEQINFQRSLEGELSRSIESLGPVSRARVHLALAKESVFVREREPATASVILTLHGGRTLGEGQVMAIAHMVSSSVPELATEDVTVVDHNGRLLSQPGGPGRDLDGTQLDYVQEVERSYQRRIENILIPVLGRANVRAQVTAEVDFTRREETAERYGPNQDPERAAVRSLQHSADYQGSDDLARGIPGALTNTPPGVAPSPINNPPEEGADEEQVDEEQEPQGEAANARLSQDRVINYEVDRNVAHIQHERGRVERLSVAVVVNYRDGLDEAGEPTAQPLSDEELDQIQRLTRQAMGFSPARGDALEVVNSPFTLAEDSAAELAWWQDPELQGLIFGIARYVLVLLAALLLYWLVLRPLIKRYTEAPAPIAVPAGASGKLLASVGDEDDAGDEPAEGEARGEGDEGGREGREQKRRRKAGAYEQNLNDLRELAQEDPRLVAMILSSWVNDDE
ncbi:flagellar M-ring protein [Bisbaumannia pacifica]|uniref:Flagellar M-ring protein n=1 Tax=Bisbaumannia pacifica TaxID=77098 RepID=A0A510X985_9GAMM|nr:flagellar basal-body MS-ring/collar protein FliF [Halomonas pacifica]GEK48016.1 flagellar M-ring protein [Halomonas pacifica]